MGWTEEKSVLWTSSKPGTEVVFGCIREYGMGKLAPLMLKEDLFLCQQHKPHPVRQHHQKAAKLTWKRTAVLSHPKWIPQNDIIPSLNDVGSVCWRSECEEVVCC